MHAIRFVLVIALLFSFQVAALEGPIIDPNGGKSLTVGSGRGPLIDPDGGQRRVTSSGDRGAGLDPNG